MANIEIPNNIISINRGAFGVNSSLTSIVIPGSVEYIGSSAFYYCTNLYKVEVCEGLKTICQYAFSSCSKLAEVILQKGVEIIEDYAFKGCKNLNFLRTYSEEPPRISSNSFYDTPYTKRLEVKKGCVDKYKLKWSEGGFYNIVEFE